MIAMRKEVVFTERVPAPPGPYSRGVLAEGRPFFLLGQIPVNLETGEPETDPIEEHFRRTVENIPGIVNARAMGEVSSLPEGMAVEIEAITVLPKVRE